MKRKEMRERDQKRNDVAQVQLSSVTPLMLMWKVQWDLDFLTDAYQP